MYKVKNVLGIDWGSKYIGLAYVNEQTKIVFPIGSMENDNLFFHTFGDVISQYSIYKIVVGYPANQEDVQKKIDAFIKQIEYVINNTKIEIEKCNEDYTSVQAGAVTGNFKKNPAEDTLASMKILENRLVNVKS